MCTSITVLFQIKNLDDTKLSHILIQFELDLIGKKTFMVWKMKAKHTKKDMTVFCVYGHLDVL